jgi:hypothetical protein
VTSPDRDRLPDCDPVSSAAVCVLFLLLVGWFVWHLVAPPVLRVSPALRAEPIPPDYGARDPVSRRLFPPVPGRTPTDPRASRSIDGAPLPSQPFPRPPRSAGGN